jgi:tRNA A-37 threonylcarbamoyl transferase component Bud32
VVLFMICQKHTSQENPLDVFGPLLSRMGIDINQRNIVFTPLAGGVSSDIWRVDIQNRPSLCVKRALAQLKVEAEWFAPVTRNSFEVAWYSAANELVPDSTPHVHAHDPEGGMFIMDFLPPDTYPLWKDRLSKGDVNPVFAGSVGTTVGKIHAGTADNDPIADRFKTDDAFYDLRLEPYLAASALVHTDIAARLHHLIEVTQAHKRVLVHGDISPKNILVGPKGPVILDAECAWYGDPAFDVAFCLNHLLLKCLLAPAAVDNLLHSFDLFFEAYRAHIAWEPACELEQRITHLLPGLLLARIDGKSPVEYIQDTIEKTRVITFARYFLTNPTAKLSDITTTWKKEMTHDG